MYRFVLILLFVINPKQQHTFLCLARLNRELAQLSPWVNILVKFNSSYQRLALVHTKINLTGS